MLESHVYSVSEITAEIKQQLESKYPHLWIEGEISNFKKHFSGHSYFTLKDANAQLSCVFWKHRSYMLRFQPDDGMHVLAHGKITVYEKYGKYQFDVQEMQPKGIGELQAAFDQLKRKLEAEGLFDTAAKISLPAFPKCIGIVTSPTGAAIRDISSVMSRRSPYVQAILCPVKVQGDGAAEEIAQAIRDCNTYGGFDLLIVGRGGGSLEDLWAFNEEIVARAIFSSRIPVVSAVGHEIDFSISDFVADVRAATPSAAAELIAPASKDVQATIQQYYSRIIQAIEACIRTRVEKLSALRRSYALNRPVDLLYQRSQHLDDLMHRMIIAFPQTIQRHDQNLRRLEGRLQTLNPVSVLNRGYSITTKMPDQDIVRDTASLKPSDEVQIQVARGKFRGIVKDIEDTDEEKSKEF